MAIRCGIPGATWRSRGVYPATRPDDLFVHYADNPRLQDPTTLAALLSQIKAKEMAVAGETLSGEIIPMPAEKSLLVVAPYEEMSAWRALIERFDRQQALVTEHYQPQRFGLAETAQLVEEVVHGTDACYVARPMT